MKFREQKIGGVWLIEAEPLADDRGAFRRHFCHQEFKQRGIESQILQTNISENYRKYTLRGFHYQVKPHEESKTLSCIRGAIYNIVVDLRPGSSTFLQWIPFELKADDELSLHVPAGCANAYLTLEDSTTILYYMSEAYSAGAYRGFRYNDPLFGFQWPAEPAVISEKDRSYPDFDTLNLQA
ncbi:MAG: dTDP-4-dehydrorhamnose 3,5-epimerase family protein [Desulfomonile tiedjei]|nr:dTDP-4-dehydrorhamnose 3,5-epimerase family protein [Desulfomonile tiedjei]